MPKFDALPTFTPSDPLRANAYPEDLNDMAAGLSDDQALRKIGQRTSTSGKIVALLMVAGVVGLAMFYMQRSEAYESRMDGVSAAGKLKGPEMLAALRAEFGKTDYADVKERVVMNLGHFKDKESVPVLIKALDDAGIVRRAAALALAAIGSPDADAAKPKLLASLKTSDEKDLTQVVWALAVLAEPNASDAILKQFVAGRLQKQPDFDPKVLTRAIGIAKLSSPDLTGHKDKPVRALVAMALSEAASPQVVAPLVSMLTRADEDPEVIRAAVAGLGRAGDAAAAGPLFQLMQDKPEMRQSVLDALAKSTAAPELATLLKEAKDTANKRDLVRLLRKTFDPRIADVLGTLVEDPDEDTRAEATHALAEMGDARAVAPLLALARSEEDDVANDAVDALRRMGVPEAGAPLMELYKEAAAADWVVPLRKSGLMRALGASHYAGACSTLVSELEGDDIGAAAKAIGEVPCERDYGKLVALLPRSKYKDIDFSRPSVPSEMAYRNRLEALQGLSYFGIPDKKAAAEMYAIIDDQEDDFRLGGVAGSALGQIADADIYAVMLEKINDSSAEERVRISYAQGLWRKPNAELSAALMPVLEGDAPAPIKRAAAFAIGYAGSPANDAKLMELLDNPTARRDAVIAAVLGGSPEAALKLVGVLAKDRDAEEVLRMHVNSNEDDFFNVLSEANFTSGQIYRRLKVAEVLKGGTEKMSYGYVYTQLITRLRAGCGRTGGVSPRFIRGELYKTLTGDDADKRALAARVLASMNLRGLLLAARDAKIDEARQVLLEMDRPRQAAN